MHATGQTIPAVAPGRWTISPAPGGGLAAVVTFPKFRNIDDLSAQLTIWAKLIRAAGAEHLLIPVVMLKETAAPAVFFEVPWQVGRDALPAYVPPQSVLHLVARIAAVLDRLHSDGLVHGALGMDSIWWINPDEFVIPDAALAHILEGVVAPNPASATYLAPEVLRASRPVPASDQYSLAVIAYELLTGRAITPVDSVEGLVAIEPLEIDPMRPLYAGASLAIGEVLKRALSANPSVRFSSCSEFAEALAGHVEALPHSLPTIHASLQNDGVRRRRRFLGLGVSVVSIGALATFYLNQRPELSLPSARAFARNLPTPDHIEIVRSTQGPPPLFYSPSVRPLSGNASAATSIQLGVTTSGTATSAQSGSRTDGSTSPTEPAITVLTRDGRFDPPARTIPGGVLVQRRADSGAQLSARALPVASDSVRTTSVEAPVDASVDSSTSTSQPKSGDENATTRGPQSATLADAFVQLDVPRGSSVYLDGVLVNQPGKVLRVSAGRHDIDVVDSQSQQSTRRRITVGASDTVIVRVALPR